MGKIKIPKNRDIEEIVEQEESKTKIENMKEVIIQMEEKEFRNRIKHENMSIDKKMQNVSSRKDAELADEKRKLKYIKAINKLQEREER